MGNGAGTRAGSRGRRINNHVLSSVNIDFVVFYFLLIRPQQKKAKEHKQMLEGLKKGDKVITSGGVYAVIEAVGTTTVTLKIAENVKVKFGKAYIAAVRPASEEE